MAIDRAEWHYGGKFPPQLPAENAGTHIGMFLAWAIMAGLESGMHQRDSGAGLEAVRGRRMTGRRFLAEFCDEKLTSEMLNEIGSRFAEAYYESDPPLYFLDYDRVLGSALPTLYHVEDSWENFDRLAPVIQARFDAWRRGDPVWGTPVPAQDQPPDTR